MGVGGALLVAIVVVVVQILRKRYAHHRAVTEMEERNSTVPIGLGPEIGDVPRPISVARCSNLAPLQARAGWGALSSDETIDEPGKDKHIRKSKRLSVSLPKRVRQRGIPMKRLKHLSAIIESPRSKTAKSPSPAGKDGTPKQTRKFHTMGKLVEGDIFACPGSPKADLLPRFAIRYPGMYGAAIANDEDRPRPPRSMSVGAIMGPIVEEVLPSSIYESKPGRPAMHGRSVSLGAPQTLPPSGPVPPVPDITARAVSIDEHYRRGVCVTRSMSLSSQESGGSSLLISSPILTAHPVSSPTVEDVVANDDSAQLKSGSKRQLQKSLLTGPRPIDPIMAPRADVIDPALHRMNHSIHSASARYSTDSISLSIAGHRLSTASTSSNDSGRNRLSIPQLGNADRMSISRVSSYNSLKSQGQPMGIQKISTPRKVSRVSALGSPAERKKQSVPGEISGNANYITPSRQPSHSTQNSARSSNGNPFQWDQFDQPSLKVPKPSALKGSPNARKGHRRQNCVRISTLTPQILGPPPSRPTSPGIMHGIEEEGSIDGEDAHYQAAAGLTYLREQAKMSRPPSASSFAPVLNPPVQTLRASLTPSSPTLSAWTAYQEHGLPTDNPLNLSPIARTSSRQSGRSSNFSIPSFPSPIKATTSGSGIQREQPVPEFYISRPSTDGPDENDSPFSLRSSPNHDIPSSPPLLAPQKTADIAVWPTSDFPSLRPTAIEYDPASPSWDTTEVGERSSQFLPFAFTSNPGRKLEEPEDNVSPRSRPASYGGALPDTPPVSPKTMPAELPDAPGLQRGELSPVEEEPVLTSANASTLLEGMSRPPDFPGAPILSPTRQDEVCTTPRMIRQRAVSNAVPRFEPLRPAPRPPMASPLEPTSPSPLYGIHVSPQGPRDEPARSVLKNAQALRRM